MAQREDGLLVALRRRSVYPTYPLRNWRRRTAGEDDLGEPPGSPNAAIAVLLLKDRVAVRRSG